MKEKQKYRCLGLMSGTSLDGLDIVFCEFISRTTGWEFRLLGSQTLPYPGTWRDLLEKSYTMDASSLAELDHSYGRFLGAVCCDFLAGNSGDPSFIASHGHTVFHRPDLGYTLQIGNGHDIAAVTCLPVIYDFRSRDVSLGGQGAPLVPAGDKLLFGDYDICLNIGGYSNLSYDDEKGRRIAYDICPANTLLNFVSRRLGKEFDHNGDFGREGKIIRELFGKLESIGFYDLEPPKSMGKEMLEEFFMPCIANEKSRPEDILRTLYEHISLQIARSLNARPAGKVLLTGGGARNAFLAGLLRDRCRHEIIIPDDGLVEYKEAIVFAFLGLLRMLGENNCFSSVTGASSDNSGGLIVWPGREN